MKKKFVIIFLIVITAIILMILSKCNTKEEYGVIPVPDESHIVIDEVTLEQIEERARELEAKYSDNMGMEYEDFYSLLVGSNYDYLSNESRGKWQTMRENYKDINSTLWNYSGVVASNWNFLYSIKLGYKPYDYFRCPHFSELFFDDDLIAQADFLERQMFNYVYEQDDSAIYNITAHILSHEQPMVTEYAPLHCKGEIMRGSAGYCMSKVIILFLRQTVDRYEDIEVYGADIGLIPYPNMPGYY